MDGDTHVKINDEVKWRLKFNIVFNPCPLTRGSWFIRFKVKDHNVELMWLKRVKWSWIYNKYQRHNRLPCTNYTNKINSFTEYPDPPVCYQTQSLKHPWSITLSSTVRSCTVWLEMFQDTYWNQRIWLLLHWTKDTKVNVSRCCNVQSLKVMPRSAAKSQRHGCAIFRQWQLRDFISNPPTTARTLRNEAVFVAFVIPKSAPAKKDQVKKVKREEWCLLCTNFPAGWRNNPNYTKKKWRDGIRVCADELCIQDMPNTMRVRTNGTFMHTLTYAR